MSGPRALLPPGWPPPKGYANGMAASGRIVVTGGLIGWDEREVFADGFLGQARQALLNLHAVLVAGGAEPRHLMRLNWYVVDMDEYLENRKALGPIYREILGRHFPAMAVMQIVRLVEPAARLEIEGTAVVTEERE
ncbi:MAG: RidA family protein [Acidobacteriota bacterium]